MPVANSPQELQATVLAAVRDLVRELGSPDAADRATLQSSLDRDLALGSLERVELLVRLERRLNARLPEQGLLAAETPGDWAHIALKAQETATAQARWPITQPRREAYPAPDSALTFTEVLGQQAERDPARVHIHLLDGDGGKDIDHGSLHAAASEVAAGLVAEGLRHGETVAIMLPTCEEFFSSFLGIMLAGGIAVPVYPPTRPNQIQAYIERQALILRNAEVRFLISFAQVRAVAEILAGKLPALRAVTTAAHLARRGRGGTAVPRDPADIFFIQYTSGSTGDPKGVTLTHANVLANIRGIGHAVQVRPSDAVVTWLPLYHDMGLIGSWLFSLYYGLPITVLSPLDFLVRPERWLWALSDSGGTLCPAPNFAFELCMRKIGVDALDGVDLSRWRVAINAGEPVLPATLRRFAERYRPWGFDSRSFMPFYGLAESSVALTYPPYWRGPLIDRIRREAYEEKGRAVPAAGLPDRDALEFVGNGRPLPGHEVRIADESGGLLPDRVRGRILFRGPSRTDGYFRNSDATAEVLDEDGWMDSGDLGYVADNELYVTGRLKDCIIKGGRNIIPQDVEMTSWEVNGVRKGCVAAFGCTDAETGTEKMVVVSETRVTDARQRRRIVTAVIDTVAGSVGIPPDEVVLAHPGFIPKTSSGKIRRLETRKLYLEGAVATRPPKGARLRLALIWLHGSMRAAAKVVRRKAVRGCRGLLDFSGACLAAVAGIAARIAPTQAAARFVIAPSARGVMRLSGAGTTGAIGGRKPSLVLASRAGRLDPLALAAAFRRSFVFADRTGFWDLGPCRAFLLEPLLTRHSGNGAGRCQAATPEAIAAALRDGYSVASLADNPAGEPAARTRFRAEAFEAAAAGEAKVLPVVLGAWRGKVRVTPCGELEGLGDLGLMDARSAVRSALQERDS